MNAAERQPGGRPASWAWTVCGLLMLASAINYMDRQTLAGAAVRIKAEFGLDQTRYGRVEEAFAYAFAAGSVVFGWAADRLRVRRLYAVVLVLWSAAGFATGFVRDAGELALCRAALGFFEAGHWPCAIRTTRLVLDARRRPAGNGLLQSGASLGAILTPLLLAWILGGATGPGAWRRPFLWVGVAGMLWIVPWLWTTRDADLPREAPSAGGGWAGFGRVLRDRRIWVVLGMVACINTAWQVLRAWMVIFLQEKRGYTEAQALYFNSAWFAAADVGCIAAGFLATRWARGGRDPHRARLMAFASCAGLCALLALVPWLGKGPWLLAVLSLVAMGALGVFPIYHAFTQELPAEHQGKVTGIAGVAGWLVPAQAQRWFGVVADHTKSFDAGFMAASVLPLLAFALVAFGWGKRDTARDTVRGSRAGGASG